MKSEMRVNEFEFICPFCNANLTISLANIKQVVLCHKCYRPIVSDDPDSKIRNTRSVVLTSTENRLPDPVFHSGTLLI